MMNSVHNNKEKDNDALKDTQRESADDSITSGVNHATAFKNDTEAMNSTTSTSSGATTSGWSTKWTAGVKTIHKPIMAGVLFLTTTSSYRPKQTIMFITLLSFVLVAIGIVTNFSVDVDEDVLWTPMGSKPIQYMNWINTESNFPKSPRYFSYFFHANGNNVATKLYIQRIFDAIDIIREQPSYQQLCEKYGTTVYSSNDDPIIMMDDENNNATTDSMSSMSSQPNETKRRTTCEISGIIRYWNTSTRVYEGTVTSDQDVLEDISSPTYPDGTPVSIDSIAGYVERDPNTLLVQTVKSFTINIALPDVEEIEDPELEYVDTVLALNEIWALQDDTTTGGGFRVECQAEGSFSSEFSRAIVNDIPLIPIVFTIMSIFTCFVFWKRDKIKSRSLLGFFIVVSVFLSIMSGYGLLFTCGIPLTSMTQILPFIVFGVGLDDAFIIMGEYLRTDTTLSPEQRVRVTIEEVGISITLTTLTSITAFGLGCTSTIPAVYWLCLYAFPTIAFVWFYQLTFVIACLVLDERRINAQKRDCCFWIQVPNTTTTDDQDDNDNHNDNDDDDDDVDTPKDDENNDKNTNKNTNSIQIAGEETLSASDRFMIWYAERLLHPVSKVVVLVSAVVVCALCAWSASKLTQEFKFTDVLPSDSYITDYTSAEDLYSQRGGLDVGIYFRDVNQSDPDVQQQMEDYINDLVGIESITNQPDHCWLRDLKQFVNNTILEKLDFNQHINAFMNNSVYYDLYKDDIVRDPVSGQIVTSRCFVTIDNIDVEDVQQQTDAMNDQMDVTSSQLINIGKSEYPFFNYDGIHNIWQFYDRVVYELIGNTILGVVTVSLIGMILIPHWTATLFVFPVTCMMYVDMLGFMQWFGVHINAVSYVSMVMSIGLVVDFVMHVIMRYYECPGNRKEKTIEMLRTIGVSVFTGGFSTLLGTLPLAFSSSEIFFTIFVVFLGLVIFGVTHSLIVIPVLVSTFGSEDQVSTSIAHKNPSTKPQNP